MHLLPPLANDKIIAFADLPFVPNPAMSPQLQVPPTNSSAFQFPLLRATPLKESRSLTLGVPIQLRFARCVNMEFMQERDSFVNLDSTLRILLYGLLRLVREDVRPVS